METPSSSGHGDRGLSMHVCMHMCFANMSQCTIFRAPLFSILSKLKSTIKKYTRESHDFCVCILFGRKYAMHCAICQIYGKWENLRMFRKYCIRCQLILYCRIEIRLPLKLVLSGPVTIKIKIKVSSKARPVIIPLSAQSASRISQ
jgi:hypothetical protein